MHESVVKSNVTTGEQTLRMQGIVLKRTPTICPIRDENWFLSQIESCEERLRQLRVEAVATTPNQTWFDRVRTAR
jgi:hypothetical protein